MYYLSGDETYINNNIKKGS